MTSRIDALSRPMENLVLRLLPRRRFGVALRYGASAAIVGVAVLLRLSLETPLHAFPLLLFFPPIFLSALMFDRGSGFFATLLSAIISAYIFFEPVFSFRIGLESGLVLVIFVLIGFGISAVIEALRHAVAQLDESERAKALLLEEMAHRTKNDLSIISSAIQLQSRAAPTREVRDALDAANTRVLVVARAQERLRGHSDAGTVDLAEYIGSLCQGLGDLLRDVRPIAVQVKCLPIAVPSSTAVHVGLIVNELVTNSLKYAYPQDRGGTIAVEVSHHADRLAVQVSDDGVGCPSGATPGLGSKLVVLLAKQLGGVVTNEAMDRGCRVRVVLNDAHG